MYLNYVADVDFGRRLLSGSLKSVRAFQGACPDIFTAAEYSHYI